MARSGPVVVGALAVLALAVPLASAFYLPGVAPTDYQHNEVLTAKVEALTSVRTQLPYEYYVLPFCKQGVDMDKQDALNLGEVLRGSRIYQTPYTFEMGKNQDCKILCRKKYDKEQIQAFALMIEEEYRAHFLLDNLPVAMAVFHENDEGETVKAYETGYPLGHVVQPESDKKSEDRRRRLLRADDDEEEDSISRRGGDNNDDEEAEEEKEEKPSRRQRDEEEEEEAEEGEEEKPSRRKSREDDEDEEDNKKKRKSHDDDEEEEDKKPRNPKDAQIVLFNHLRFTILYHEDPTRHGMRIVGYEVEPFSVKHDYVNKVDFEECLNQVAGDDNDCALETCSADSPVGINSAPLVLDTKREKHTEVIWTYDIRYQPSKIKWSTRWDTYLQSADDAQVHWFSIMNSFMIVLFLSGLVAMIMIRTIKKDFQRYEQQDFLEDGQEETGWKLVHGDVFRPPTMSGWLSVLVGSGVQLTVSLVFLMIFACFGFLSPANRGALMQAMLFLFVFMGMVGGYTSARLFRSFKGNKWKSNSLWTAMLFPGFCFGIFFILNLLIWGQKSSGAVPFGTLFALLCMWFGISTPLVFLGSYFGFRKAPIDFPTRTNQIPRQVPAQPWFVNGFLNILVGGVLPFGAVFVEVFYVLSSIWLHQFYYMFGFLFLVVLILLMTCAEITVVTCYFQLCCENYHWWWRAFFTSGCSSLYLFVYSLYYAFAKLQMARALAGLVYVGYMCIVCTAFFLITGSFGFLVCFFFVRQIYSAIKID